MMSCLWIQGPCDVFVHQCSADEDVDTGSLCSDTEALSVSEANHHRVSPAELVLPRSSTSLCTCKGVGADGRTTEERCSLRMPRRSSLRSSYASSYASSEDGSSSCGTSTSSKSERSVTVRHPCYARLADVTMSLPLQLFHAGPSSSSVMRSDDHR